MEGAALAEEILEATMQDMRKSSSGRELLQRAPSIWQLAKRNGRSLGEYDRNVEGDRHSLGDDKYDRYFRGEEEVHEPKPLKTIDVSQAMVRSYAPEEGQRKARLILEHAKVTFLTPWLFTFARRTLTQNMPATRKNMIIILLLHSFFFVSHGTSTFH